MSKHSRSSSIWHVVRLVVPLFPLVAGFVALALWLGGINGLLMAIVVAGCLMLAWSKQAERVLIHDQDVRDLDPSEHADLIALLSRLAMTAGVTVPRLRIIVHPIPNGFAIGLNRTTGTIFITSGLVDTLTRDELAGVLGHELAHIRNHDTAIMTTVAAFTMTTLCMAAALSLIGICIGRRGGLTVQVLAAISAASAVVIAVAMSRGREYEADRLGAEICGDPQHLISALRKVIKPGRSVRGFGRSKSQLAFHPALAPLLFVDPNTPATPGGLFSSHPSVSARIARLERLASARS